MYRGVFALAWRGLGCLLGVTAVISLMTAAQSGDRTAALVAMLLAASAWWLWHRPQAARERAEAEARAKAEKKAAEEKGHRGPTLEDRLLEVEALLAQMQGEGQVDEIECVALAEMAAADMESGPEALDEMRRMGGRETSDGAASHNAFLRRLVMGLALERLRKPGGLDAPHPWQRQLPAP